MKIEKELLRDMSMEKFGLSVRAMNVLLNRKLNCETIEDIMSLDAGTIMVQHACGIKTANEIYEFQNFLKETSIKSLENYIEETHPRVFPEHVSRLGIYSEDDIVLLNDFLEKNGIDFFEISEPIFLNKREMVTDVCLLYRIRDTTLSNALMDLRRLLYKKHKDDND